MKVKFKDMTKSMKDLFLIGVTRYHEENPEDNYAGCSNSKGEDIDIQFLVNGREMDFQNICGRLESEMQRVVNEESEKMFFEKYGEMENEIQEILEDAKDKIDDAIMNFYTGEDRKENV